MFHAPDWLNRKLYPFDSHWVAIDENQIHYIDEGQGPIVLFVHGTPEWSFGYRDLIIELRSQFRCIAIDLLGFGLSDKPEQGDYTCQAHARRLHEFIEQLRLENFTLMANDFGGAIGMSYVLDQPENVSHFILFNTWMWSLQNDKHYSGPAKVINSWLGKFLYLKMNFPVNTIMPSAFGNRELLTKDIHAHYKRASATSSERIAAYAFAKELMGASTWWQSLWERLPAIASKPSLIFWGMKDKFILPIELEKWKSGLKNVRVIVYDDAGHFVQEEKPKEMALEVRRLLAGSVNGK